MPHHIRNGTPNLNKSDKTQLFACILIISLNLSAHLASGLSQTKLSLAILLKCAFGFSSSMTSMLVFFSNPSIELIIMRTKSDRVRHAVGFEVIGLFLVVILGSSLLGIEAQKLGVLGVSMSLLATGWNYVFNLLFDHCLLRRTGRLNKSVLERVIHACLFEGSLVVLSVPIIAWYLNMTLLNAFMMDLALTLFYLLYTFIYNWLYDKLFPLPVIEEHK